MRKFIIKYFLITVSLLSLFSCSSIIFTNGEVQSSENLIEKSENWHHTFLLGLLEYTDPVELNKVCGKGYVWREVESRKGPLQVVVDLVMPITRVGGFIYSPWSTRVSCSARN